jgi:kinesin family protein C2/C3
VTERKRLHNLVQELRGNIRVFCRVRPLSRKNVADGARASVGFPSDTEISLDVAGKMSAFQFDRVFDPDSTQAEVFEHTQPLVVSVLDGYNVCIFAYGQTGSGKTHTMQGYGGDGGVNTRALEELFALAAQRQGVCDYEIKVSLLEIYNETIRDLLDPKDAQTGEDKKLDVKLAPEGGTTVPGMVLIPAHPRSSPAHPRSYPTHPRSSPAHPLLIPDHPRSSPAHP